MSILVTGGCGYVGKCIVKYLINLEQVKKVIILDVCELSDSDLVDHNKIVFIKADITVTSDLEKAFEGHNIEGVFHVAGYGFGGTTNLPAFNAQTKKVNVDGTQNVINACVNHNVRALVFTSTVNVVFQGREIIDGNEKSHLWVEDGQYLDYYSKTKEQAEKMVIESNCKKTKNGKNDLRTCVLRMGGIYGPDEKTILGRAFYFMSQSVGYFAFCQKKDLKIDWLHIDNAVQGHVKALTKLLDDESSNNVSGQIFYLTDDNPVNCYYVLAPLYRILKHREIPNPIPVPIIVQLVFAFFFHVLSLLLGPKFKLPYWGFTFMECYKINVNHYFSVEKAKRYLNYEPKKINQAEWKIIVDSFQKYIAPSGIVNLF